MTGPDDFLARWHALVEAWDDARSTDEDAAAALLADALRDGLGPDAPTTTGSPTGEVVAACAAALVEASGRLDAEGYRTANPEPRLLAGHVTPAQHYATAGWTALRNPRGDFDVRWYWTEHLDPTSTAVDPFVHHLLVGAHDGLATRPTRVPARPDASPAADGVRRACLLAVDDPDCVVDDALLHLVTELARHADVYVLAACLMSDAEVARLAAVATGAWAVPHGGHAPLSHALLARQLVGWDVLDGYDELLLADDSAYLVRPLDDVLARMDATPADWWGLHTSYRTVDRSVVPPTAAPARTPVLGGPEGDDWGPADHAYLSSSFLVLRGPALRDPAVRRHLDRVTAEPTPDLARVKHEIGLSDLLARSGHRPATFLETHGTEDPLLTPDWASLLEQGHPQVARDLVGRNPLRVPDLAGWADRVRAAVPDVAAGLLDDLERDLRRTAPNDALTRSLTVRTAADGTVVMDEPMTAAEFRRQDFATPTYDHWWAFPVCSYDHTFAGNERAVFEEVRDDPSIKKIVLTRSRPVDVSGENVHVVPITSSQGQYYLLRSAQVFVKHGPMSNVPWPIAPTLHNVVNVWHGIPLKRFNLASVGLTERAHAAALRAHGATRAVLASSKVDALAMAAAFYPMPLETMWQTGLPRNDHITCPESRLPAHLREALDQLRTEAAGRRVVMFLPTFKDGQADAYYSFGDDEVARLGAWLEQNDAVLAVREHMADRAHTYSRMLAPLKPINLSARRYPYLEVLYRAADVLVSDYSSCLVDFLLTGRPVISFAYDHDHYSHTERGLFYDLEEVLPGPLCRTFDELVEALDDTLVDPTEEERAVYDWKRRVFFDHLDDGASRRVVQRVKELYRWP